MLRDGKNPYVFMYNDVWHDLGLLGVKTQGLLWVVARATGARSSPLVSGPEASQKGDFWSGSATGGRNNSLDFVPSDMFSSII